MIFSDFFFFSNIFFYIVCEILVSKDMPTKVACQLEERLNKAGFTDFSQKMTPLKLNHTNKAGELLWYVICSHYLLYTN